MKVKVRVEEMKEGIDYNNLEYPIHMVWLSYSGEPNGLEGTFLSPEEFVCLSHGGSSWEVGGVCRQNIGFGDSFGVKNCWVPKNPEDLPKPAPKPYPKLMIDEGDKEIRWFLNVDVSIAIDKGDDYTNPPIGSQSSRCIGRLWRDFNGSVELSN